MKHIKEELENFLEFLKEIEEVTGQMPMVILESTGHYHSSVIQYLEEQEILYILLNPIISYQAKKSSLRKVKTDAIDAYQLCVAIFEGFFIDVKGISYFRGRIKSRKKCPSRSGQWAWGKAEKIMDSASRNPFQKNVYESNVINLRMYIELLFHYQGHLSDLEDRIVALAGTRRM